jgi:major membrane immunogen (membrane-anchored lipoprotein)
LKFLKRINNKIELARLRRSPLSVRPPQTEGFYDMKGNKTVMKKVIGAAAACLLVLITLAGCGLGGYKDGTYTATSGKDERGAYGEVTVTIKDKKVSDCKFVTWQADGTIKDENYGKENGVITNDELYAQAQLAVDAMKSYADQFVSKGKLSSVDAISGATVAYDQFREAAAKALKEAK